MTGKQYGTILADPSAQGLIRYVQDKLRAAGFDNVEVTTEW